MKILKKTQTPLDYEFRVFRHPEEETVEIITPGTGEAIANEDGSLGTFPVQIEVEDTEGGKDVQNYNVRVWADIDNSNPVITSTPELKFGLNSDTYQYQLQSFDPDGDTLTYRLAETPVGALIDKDTGELLWFPKDVANGDIVSFAVDVADSRGGKDTQSFDVEVHQALGQIQGAVFEDLNGNGFRDSKLVKGHNPAIVFAIDVSGSTEAPFPGPDGVETVLDAQKAAILALVDSLVGQGYGDRVNIGLIPHNTTTEIQDMNLAEPGEPTYTTPNADANNNGIPDIREILEGYYPHGHNDFTETLQIIENLFEVLPGDPNLIFMSDGYGHLDADVAAEVVANLEAKNVNTNAFGIGLYSTIETISKIDPDAVQLTDVEEFVDILAGWNSDYVIEPLIEGITVYIDENDSGTWDEGEPSQVSQENNIPSLLGSTKVLG